MKSQYLKQAKTKPESKTFIEQFKLATNTPHFGTLSIITGGLLLVIGIVGMILPHFMALEVTLLIASLLIMGGIAWVVYAYKYRVHTRVEWLKPLLLFTTSGLMLFYPMNGIAVMGLLLVVYLILDAFGSFTLARIIYPLKGWGWMAFNGAISLLLVMLTVIDWPTSSTIVIGLYVAISLFFDGWALIYLGWIQSKLSQ